MKLDVGGARAALREQIAEPLGLDVAEAAYGIHRIVSAHMSDATRFHVLSRGHDPRDFDLLLFGGATPVHAVSIGEDLEPRSIIIPLAGLATVLSAFGIVNSDVIRTHSTSTSLALLPESMPMLEAAYRELEDRAIREPREDGFSELMRTRIATPKVKLRAETGRAVDIGPARKGQRQAYFREEGFVAVEIYDGDRLPANSEVEGPTILEMTRASGMETCSSSTIPGWVRPTSQPAPSSLPSSSTTSSSAGPG